MALSFSIGCILLLWIGIIVYTGNTKNIFPADDDDDQSSFYPDDLDDLDDMEYDQDNEGDSLIPQVVTRYDDEDGILLPDKQGEFYLVCRKVVHESRMNGTKFEAAEFVKLRFYARSSNYQFIELRHDQVQLLPNHSRFNVDLRTKILIHGWINGSDTEVVEPLARDFLEQGNFNVIVVNWEKAARTLLYPVAKYRVEKVAEVVTAVIDQLLDFGQRPDQIGIIGHSLGAHIAGLAAKKTKQKIASIVGLDPAAPLFRVKKPMGRLSQDDAQYVEVIHTNGKGLGIFKNIGKADFYVNGGSQQPGCGWSLGCSHRRAVDYFKESLKQKDYFACRCAGVHDLKPNCSLGKAVMGGLDALKTRGKPYGVYYALTAAVKPFLRNNVLILHRERNNSALSN